ncbi:MAG: diacylglycerol/lipid kinase family protein [Fibrobacterota bacterium]
MKYTFIINPISGGGQGKAIASALPEVIESAGIAPFDYKIEYTSFPDTVLQAAEYAKKCDMLIAVGGDGTAVDVISGIMESGSNCLFTLIPLGTGNDLGRITGAYSCFKKEGLKGIIEGLLNQKSRGVDVWKVNKKQYMVNYFSVGFDAAVASDFNNMRTKKKFSGLSVFLNYLGYFLCAFRNMRKRISRGASATIVDENGREIKIRLGRYKAFIVSNVPSYGGGTLPAPSAKFDDRMLDIVVVRRMYTLAGLFFVRYFMPWFKRKYAARLTHFYASSVYLKASVKDEYQIDGEVKEKADNKNGVFSVEYAGQIRTIFFS